MWNIVIVAGVGIVAGAAAIVMNAARTKSTSPDRALPKSGSGWVQVKNSQQTEISLPEHLKVRFVRVEEQREYFEALEGVFVGQEFTVKLDAQGQSYLEDRLPAYRSGAKLKFSHNAKSLITPVGTFNAEMDPDNPIPFGTHKLQIPDFPHALGRRYMNQASKALSWFHIGEGVAIVGESERYLHTGLVSAGCITITDVEKWDKLYNYLILCRNEDQLSVGTIEVVS